MTCALATDAGAASATPLQHPHPLASAVLRIARVLAAFAGFLGRTGERLDAWLRARAKARDDSVALLAMSERELKDIGIDPARIGVGPDTWRRDWTV